MQQETPRQHNKHVGSWEKRSNHHKNLFLSETKHYTYILLLLTRSGYKNVILFIKLDRIDLFKHIGPLLTVTMHHSCDVDDNRNVIKIIYV